MFESTLFWLKNRLFRREAMRLYREALTNQHLNECDLESVNWGKRKKLVTYAYENIPFYREYYDACGFSPLQLQSEKDWVKVPILEKEQVRQGADKLVNPKVSPKYVSFTTTGGSTGTPMKVYRDKRFKLEILGWRAFTWWKVSPGDNTAITHRRVPKGWKAQLKNRLLWWPTKRVYLSASSMSEDQIAQFVHQIIRKKVVWITGYAGALECVADYILMKKQKVSSLRLVWSTSAPLSKSAREKMEQAFGCKVMNQYGSCEVSNIAQQCPYSEHMHINYDFVHVDIVDEHNWPLFDQEGDILVTDLSNYVAPLIRYRLGDRGSFANEKCTCGISLPLMKNVKGRISDMIYTPSGIVVDGNYLTTIFDNYSDTIDQFQVYQDADYSVTVFYRPKMGAEDRIDRVIVMLNETLNRDMKSEVPIVFKQVESIEHDAGKTRYIISKIALAKINNG